MSDLLYRLSSLEPSANLSRDSITEILNLQKQIEELQATGEQLEKAVSLLSSFNEYREATDRKETSKSNTKWHTYERMLYDFAKIFLEELKQKDEVK